MEANKVAPKSLPSRRGSSSCDRTTAADADRSQVWRRSLPLTLDDADRRLRAKDGPQNAASTFLSVMNELNKVRAAESGSTWLEEVAPFCRNHKVATAFSEDPYTRRALEKPRGFAGDAVMLDFLYDQSPTPGTSRLGQALFRATAFSTSGRSVVARRDMLGEAVASTIRRKPGARVVSIACGHLRELAQLPDGAQSRLDRFFAVDQDSKALSVVETTYAPGPVETVEASVRDIVAGRISFEDVDLAYASGLFDYLSDEVAQRLLARMMSFLTPGGRLIVGNFTPTNWGRSYMETFMDWRLTHRSTVQMRELGRDSGATSRAHVERVYADEFGNVSYLDLVKR